MACCFALLFSLVTLGLAQSPENELLNKTPQICNFEPIHQPVSTKRDVVLFYGTGEHHGLYLAIKSLRATGAKCRIIAMFPSFFKANTNFLEFCDKYNVELLNNCDTTKNRDTIPHMLRYEYEAKWLNEHISEIDNVIHCDAYDVFFQSDPFISIPPNSSLIFIKEQITIQQCMWNYQWIQDCYGPQELDSMKQSMIICSGVILGNAFEYLRFVTLMTDMPEWDRCYGESNDQPIVNYLIHSGELTRRHFDISFSSCFGDVLNMQWCMYQRNISLSDRYISGPNPKNVPVILHQYNRFPELSAHLHKICNVKMN